MILPLLVLVPLAGGIAAWAVRAHRAARVVSLVALALPLALVAVVAAAPAWLPPPLAARTFSAPWLPSLGIGFRLAMDGLSLPLVILTLAVGAIAVVASWREIQERVGLFHLALLATLSGVLGVFLAADLFLFYLAWELMLVPMVLLIAIWGHEQRRAAAVKFLLFTQASGLAMLVAIVALAALHRDQTGVLTFEATALAGARLAPATERVLMLGFFVAFAVKLPAFPLHTWLPDAHGEAPTAGSIVLAGLLLKTGGYGLLRFALPLFPAASREIAPLAMGLGVAGIAYGALLALGQRDLKRFIAYTSVSHLGFVLLGAYAGSPVARQGAVVQMVAHGLATPGLFVLAGALGERLGTRDLGRMGGLSATAPRMGALGLALLLASLGLPGLGNFVGELLVLAGTFPAHPALASAATAGLVLAAIYALALARRLFFGPLPREGGVADLSARETAVLALLVVALLWLGLRPEALLDAAGPVLGDLAEATP